MKALRHFLHDFAALPRDLKLLAFSIFMWGTGETLFVYIVPLYMKNLGATPAQIGTTYGLGAATLGLSVIPAGILADRWGRKRVMVLGWLAGLLSCAFMAAAGNLTVFNLGWVLYWLTGFILPAISSYIAEGRGQISPERALTMTYAGFSLGSIISPSLGGWLGAQFGLRSLFVIGTVLTGVSTLVVLLLRPQPVASAAMRPAYRQLLGNRRFLGTSALVAVAWFVMWLGFPLAPTFLAEVRGFSAAVVGVLGSFESLGAVVVSLVLGRLATRRGFLAAQVLVVIYLALLLQARWFGWIALAYFARSAALVARTLAEAQAIRLVNRAQWGLAFGLLETIASIGTVLAPLVAGRLFELDPARPFQWALFLMPLSMLLVYLGLRRFGQARPDMPLEILQAEGPPLAPPPLDFASQDDESDSPSPATRDAEGG